MLNETFNIQRQSVRREPQANNNVGNGATNSNARTASANSRAQNTQRQTNDARGNDSGISSWNSSSTTTRTFHDNFSGFNNQNQQNTSDTILCNCHEQAKQLTVRKEGPNQGRQFYKCSKPQGTGCDFFLWAEEGAAPNTTQSRSNDQPSWNGGGNSSASSNTQARQRQAPAPRNHRDAGGGSSSGVPTCTCGQPARKLVETTLTKLLQYLMYILGLGD